MEFGLSKNHVRNQKVQERIQTALDWLDARSTEELLAEPIGAKKIADGVELRFQSYDTRDYATMNYETHRKHIDIHYMIKGAEWVRWADDGDAEPVSDYDPEVEIQFFGHPKTHSKALLTDRHYAIFDPSDLHAAHGIVDGKVGHNHKLCVKIDVD
ncbi:beta-D-galactosidase [Paucilactobacillus vaccinostercus DSM 20634]|jgi:YhcH/YjgK/YiaL family protein|uniref:Beta-D-galactosidase n=1 Tax=Paucilactobacillus vaccinostercus DSM 20634 TaxID=1423813 RepID=A0A0R2A4W7_9LACO|nr:YhcH/YjgK/YiaL family protein [Paucilactobacillus vaccinostercus]KRM61727.1 beta-D-galactosidase [Paucilactobacillus vaccinostercus DSM 20634]